MQPTGTVRTVRYHRSTGSRTSDLSISDNRVKPLSQAPAGSSHARHRLKYIMFNYGLNRQMIWAPCERATRAAGRRRRQAGRAERKGVVALRSGWDCPRSLVLPVCRGLLG